MFVLWNDAYAKTNFVTFTKRAKSSLSEHRLSQLSQPDTSGEGETVFHLYIFIQTTVQGKSQASLQLPGTKRAKHALILYAQSQTEMANHYH